MRISRKNDIIGNWTEKQIKPAVESGVLLLTDFYYDEDLLDWFPIEQFLSRPPPPPKPEKSGVAACYCGSGLRFQDCHGNGSNY